MPRTNGLFDYSGVDWRFVSRILNENSARLSRTRSGRSVTAASPRKLPLLLDGEALRQRSAENEGRVHRALFAARPGRPPADGSQVQEMLLRIADMMNDGLLPAGRWRAWPLRGFLPADAVGGQAEPPAKVAPEAIPGAVASFCVAVYERWGELQEDPVPLASWSEWELNAGPLHPFYDGCGRISRSFSALLLLRSSWLLPLYESKSAYYAHADRGPDVFCGYMRERIAECRQWVAAHGR